MKSKTRRERRVAFSGLVLSALALLGAGNISFAQTSYRIERIDRPGATYYRLNNFGVISGSLNVNGVDQAHLFTHTSFVHSGTPPVALGLGPNGTPTIAKALNDMGDAAGILTNNFGLQRAALFQNGTVQDLGTLGGFYSAGWAINNSAHVVGYSTNANFANRSFLWKNGAMSDLGTLGGQESYVNAINDSGQAVGRAGIFVGSGESHAVLWENGTATDLGTLGGYSSSALDINKSGHVVGYSDLAPPTGGRHAVLWTNGLATDLGTLPGASSSEATAINDFGVIVGNAYMTNGDSRAFIFSGGQMSDLSSVVGGNTVFTSVIDINNGGQILARGTEFGQSYTYLISPFQGNWPPFAQQDSVQVLEDSADNVIRVLDNDFDHENDQMMIFQVTQGQNGGVVKRTGLDTLAYTPPANFAGVDNFQYTVLDRRGDVSTGSVSVTVKQVNDAPSFTPGTDVTVDENKITNIPNWATNISAGPNNEKPYQWVQFEVVPQEPAAFVNIYIQGDGTLVVMPAWNYNGTTTVKVRAVDDGGTQDGGVNASEYCTFSVTVQDVNNVPVAQNSEQTLNEDEPTVIFFNVNDADNDALTSTIVEGPKNGTLEKLWSDTIYGYIPNSNFTGEDSFTFKVNDGKADSQTATVKLTVQPVNDPPTAEDFVAGKIFKTETKTITLSDVKAQDIDGDALHFVLPATSTEKGAITSNESGTTLTYTPKANRSGVDSFAFKVTDGKSDTQHNISISIENRAPQPQPDSGITLTPGEKTLVDVLANDSDPDGDSLKVVDATGNASGLTLDYTNGQLYVTASETTAQNVEIKYSVRDNDTDNAHTADPTCAITVMAANTSAPVARDDEYSFAKSASARTLDVLTNDSDADPTYNQLTISALDTSTLSGATASISNDGQSIQFQSDGTGSFSFRYKIKDSHPTNPRQSNWATVTVNYTNAAPVAKPQNLETDEDQSLPITLVATDADGDTLEYSVASQPAHGTLSGSVPNLVYTPYANFNGSDSFSFSANDGIATDTATISIEVKPINDAPVANGQTLQTNEDTALNITLSASDIDGDSLEYSIAGAPSYGTLSGSGTNRVYTPSANFNGSDAFTFKVSDGKTNSNVATVLISVQPQNDAPVANAGADKTVFLNGLMASVTLDGNNSYDVDGDSLTYTWREGNNILATGVSPTVNLPEGIHTISLTVTDPSNAFSSDTVVITAKMPSSTANTSVKGSGNVTVSGGKVEAKFQGSFSKGKLSGSVSYSDSRNGGYKLTSTAIQSVVISGKNGKIFGTGKVTMGRTTQSVKFSIQGDDLFAAKLNQGDTISLQVSDGYSFNGTYTRGDVSVSGGTP